MGYSLRPQVNSAVNFYDARNAVSETRITAFPPNVCKLCSKHLQSAPRCFFFLAPPSSTHSGHADADITSAKPPLSTSGRDSAPPLYPGAKPGPFDPAGVTDPNTTAFVVSLKPKP